jgi:ABC-type sugar transport system permease subunit
MTTPDYLTILSTVVSLALSCLMSLALATEERRRAVLRTAGIAALVALFSPLIVIASPVIAYVIWRLYYARHPKR